MGYENDWSAGDSFLAFVGGVFILIAAAVLFIAGYLVVDFIF